MRNISFCIAACFFVLLLAGCGGSGTKDMLGEWVVTDAQGVVLRTMDLRKDGKLVIFEENRKSGGKWELDEAGNLSFQTGDLAYRYDRLEDTLNHLLMRLEGKESPSHFYRKADFLDSKRDLGVQLPSILKGIRDLGERERSQIDLSRVEEDDSTAVLEQMMDDGREFRVELSLKKVEPLKDFSYEEWEVQSLLLSEPVKVVAEKFLKAMKVKDYDTAKQLATREAQASIEMKAGFEGDKAAKGNPETIKIGEVEGEGDTRTVHYTDEGKELTLTLVIRDGKWKAAWEKGTPDVQNPPPPPSSK